MLTAERLQSPTFRGGGGGGRPSAVANKRFAAAAAAAAAAEAEAEAETHATSTAGLGNDQGRGGWQAHNTRVRLWLAFGFVCFRRRSPYQSSLSVTSLS